MAIAFLPRKSEYRQGTRLGDKARKRTDGQRIIATTGSAGARARGAGSDHNGNGFGGGNIDFPHDDRRWDPDPDPERWATPLAAYRAAAVFIMFSITSVFLTLTHILQSRWVHSKDWVSIPLPHILYVNTGVLIASSATIEVARRCAKREAQGEGGKGCGRWLVATLILGLAFLGGQLVAWRELASQGLYVASNAGGFLFYFLTATHGLHLLVGIAALSYIAVFAARLAQRNRQQTAVGAVALYWHFLDGLWLYVFGLLLTTIQR